MANVKHIRPSWLGLMAMLLWVSGCKTCGSNVASPRPIPNHEASADAGTVPAEERLPTTGCANGGCETPQLPPSVTTGFANCPTGSCNPGSMNGRGIYVASDNSYCFKYVYSADARYPYFFCPEFFSNGTLNGRRRVVLHVRDWTSPTAALRESQVGAWLEPVPGSKQPVQLVSIRSDKTRLVITYKTADDAPEQEVMGSGLSSLRLGFAFRAIDEDHTYEVKLEPVTATGSGREELQRYRLFYRFRTGSTTPPTEWTPHCEDATSGNQLSFLGGKRVDGLTALVTDAPEVTTLSCERGTISTCLAWGYTPWNPKARSDRAADYLFGSCLQAKRAAYFARSGDFSSYTKSGTPIHKRDPFGINAEPVENLEALWSPRGAECLNLANVRRDELRPQLTGLKRDAGLGDCTETRWEQSELGRLATSPQSVH